MSRLGFPVISADCHVIEPPGLWTERIASRSRGREPRVERVGDTDLWVVDDRRRMAVVGIQAQAGLRFSAPERISKRGFYSAIPELTPERCLADFDVDGVSAALMFGSNAHQAYRVVGGDLLADIFRAFNDWVLEFCRAGRGRLAAVTVLPVDDVDLGIAELERTVDRGAAAAMIPILPVAGRRYDQPRFEPLWAAAEAAGVPLLFHVGANQAVVGREPVIDLVRHGMKDLHVRASLAAMILSGVFARHPGLRIGVVEFEASWVPHLGAAMDEHVASGRARAVTSFRDGERPSDHLRRNVFVVFQEDAACIRARAAIGVENLLWGSDYPHAEATFPRSHEILGAQLEGVPEREARLMVGENAARLFGLAVRSPALS